MVLLEGGGIRGRDDRTEPDEHDLQATGHCLGCYSSGYSDALKMVIIQNTTPPKRYHLTADQGKAVQEILNRYVGEELRPRLERSKMSDDMFEHLSDGDRIQNDIDYITDLAKLFD